jgi:uncharacterized protein (TIGR03663 family)
MMVELKGIPDRSVKYFKAHFTREIAFYVALAIIALIMRVWQLGDRAVHYDECIHLGCAWNICSNPFGWCLDAWTHGHFQFIGTALFFRFGQSDFTARILPVIFGTLIVILPYFLRRQLGRWGAMAAAVMLALSPLFMYYSRYARDDIYIAFFTLLLVVCLWNYIDSKKSRWLYTGAATLSFSFCAMEITYINIAIIALFLLVVTGREIASKVRRKLDLKDASPQLELLILFGTLSLPLFGAFVNLIPGVDLGQDMSSPWSIVIVCVLFVISAAIGLRWSPRRWIIAAVIFYVIFILEYTIFFTSPRGAVTGLWGNVAYWVSQHGVHRGSQPNFYYMMLIPIYEFLPIILASIAVVYSMVAKNLAAILLISGTIIMVALFAFDSSLGNQGRHAVDIIVCVAGGCLILRALVPLCIRLVHSEPEHEILRRVNGNIQSINKEGIYPKLMLFIAGALILLYGLIVGDSSQTDKFTSTLLLLSAALFMVLYVHFGKLKLFNRFLIYWAAMSLILYSYFGEKMPWLSLHIVLPAIILAGSFIGYITKGLNREKIKRWIPTRDSSGIRWIYAAIGIIAVSTLLFLTGYTAVVACKESYQVSDDPPQLLMYAGISADVPRVKAQIDAFAAETGMGYDMPITVESNIYDSGWRWYLRDYKNLSTPDLTTVSSEPAGMVLIISAGHDPSDKTYLSKYGEGETVKMLIWFPEEYKSKVSPIWWWGYFLHRQTDGQDWDTKGVVYFLNTSS